MNGNINPESADHLFYFGNHFTVKLTRIRNLADSPRTVDFTSNFWDISKSKK